MSIPVIAVLAILLVVVIFLFAIPSFSAGGPRQGSEGKGVTVTNPYPGAQRVDELPKVLRKGSCAYPKDAKRLGKEGRVVFDVLVGTDGGMKEIYLIEKGGHGFDEAALAHVKTWTWKPAVLKGNPVESWIRVPIRFTLTKPGAKVT